jgi:hypothetical protein
MKWYRRLFYLYMRDQQRMGLSTMPVGSAVFMISFFALTNISSLYTLIFRSGVTGVPPAEKFLAFCASFVLLGLNFLYFLGSGRLDTIRQEFGDVEPHLETRMIRIANLLLTASMLLLFASWIAHGISVGYL